MARATRTYKLKVSPAGFDLIVDSHARLVRVSRTLLPYGFALHAALHHFASIPEETQSSAVQTFPLISLTGGRHGAAIFVGAPRALSILADGLIAQLGGQDNSRRLPEKSVLYLIALRTLLVAEEEQLLSAYSRVVGESPAHPRKRPE